MSYTPDEMRNMDIKLVNQGYDPDTVDDILEDVAAQTDELLKKMSRLESELQGSKAQQEAMSAQLEQSKNVPAVKQEGVSFNEPAYFKNLETTLRETLISAQRIADETIDDARKKARRIVTDAEEQAAALEAQSAQKLSEMRADYENLKSKGEEYHKNFSQLVEEQARLLKESPLYAVAEATEE